MWGSESETRSVRQTPVWHQPLLLLLLSASFVASADAAIIRFKKSAVVKPPVVRLMDVADVRDTDPGVVEQLNQIVLAPAPAAGGRLRIDFATIRSRLQAQGVNLVQMEFAGSSIIQVSVAKQIERPKHRLQDVPRRVAGWKRERAEKHVAEAIEQYLSRYAPELGIVAVNVQIDEKDILPTLAGADSGFEVRGGKPPWNAPQEFHLRFFDRNEKIVQLRARAHISQHPRVVAVKHTVNRGDVLTWGDLVWRQMRPGGEGFSRMEEVVNKEATSTLRADEPVTAQDVRAVPLVRSNDIVTVYSRQPGILVTSQLKARSDGAQGDTIKLVSLDGRENVLARITGYHEAEVIGSNPATASRNPTTGRIRFRAAGVRTPPSVRRQANPTRHDQGRGGP